MANTIFVDTNKLPRISTPEGEVVQVLNQQLQGAKNVLGMLRWLKSGETLKAEAGSKHQLLYLMEGEGTITLEDKTHDVTKGMGVYLGPAETAVISARPGSTLKLFHLVVPQIPK